MQMMTRYSYVMVVMRAITHIASTPLFQRYLKAHGFVQLVQGSKILHSIHLAKSMCWKGSGKAQSQEDLFDGCTFLSFLTVTTFSCIFSYKHGSHRVVLLLEEQNANVALTLEWKLRMQMHATCSDQAHMLGHTWGASLAYGYTPKDENGFVLTSMSMKCVQNDVV